MKELFHAKESRKRIKHIKFGVFAPQEVAELAEIEVCNRELYSVQDRTPIRNGVLDRRLGISDKTSTCETCGAKLADCAGHWGYVKLALPVFHIGFFRALIQILQEMCKECGRVLLPGEERAQFLRRLRAPRLDSLQRQALVKAVHERARKTAVCPWCGAANGFVRKVGVMKVVHEKYRGGRRQQEEGDAFRGAFARAAAANGELRAHVGKAQEDLSALRVQELLGRLGAEDAELLGLVGGVRPEQLLWTHVPVPPACIRPSVAMSQEGGSNEDDLTVKLSEIVYTNFIIRDALAKGATAQMLVEDWDFLQLQCATYINSELPGVPLALQTPGKPIRGLCQRLKGKMGRFRGNLSGKRVDFSARTVISPDPNLRVDEVAVPVHVARVLTYPEAVTRANIERLRALVAAGPDAHPGANFLQTGAGAGAGLKRYLRYGDRRRMARELRPGDVVERHLQDGDVVLFNRQPSLHKLSIMAHRAVVRPWRTFRFNECACTPYNADFDGDEMNLHLPQTEEARAEAAELLGLQHNLVTPRNGQPLVAAMQDFITAAHLLTQRDVFLDRAQLGHLLAAFSDARTHVDVPPPALLRPAALWTGKQVIGCLLCPRRARARAACAAINLEGRTRTYSGAGADLCPRDGWLVVRDAQLLAGTLDKGSVGGDSKASLFYVLLREQGPAAAVTCMTRLSKLCARFLGARGFSIGIDDVTPGPRLRARKDELVAAGYAACDAHIAAFEQGALALQPGCSASQTLEAAISGVLSRIRDDCGQLCVQELPRTNAPLLMQWCGSKGSRINVSQMVACVGQQIIAGQRIPDGFLGRSLPHFPKGSRVPPAKGFVCASFYSGLSPTEFFFHAVSGREGLVDTAVKTAETGYMQRRLMKALEDLSTHYDGTVRNATGGVVQFCYGDDGLDPALMEGLDGSPVNLVRLLTTAHEQVRASARIEGNVDVRGGVDVSVGGCAQGCSSASHSASHSASISASLSTHPAPNDSDNDPSTPSSVTPAYIHSETARHAEAEGWSAGFSTALGDFLAQQPLTDAVLQRALQLAAHKYARARIEPGTAVGALAGQSIGEPGTQMTLKTFHFAGVASMNVTLGVPRIKEIINAARTIATPIITAPLACPRSLPAARACKGRVEKTLLGDIAARIDQVVRADGVFVRIDVDLDAAAALALGAGLGAVERAVARCTRLVRLVGPGLRVRALPPGALLLQLPPQHPQLLLLAQQVRRLLPGVVVAGIASVGRAVINDLGAQRGFNLLVEGYGLRDVMATEGVVGTAVSSNHVAETETVLGIEAARATIIHEVTDTMARHGMTIDARHVALLADVMTYRGMVLGITRFGIAKMKDSVLMLASFEKTTDHLFDAARFAKRDDIDGVSECIIMGAPMPVGTGLFRLLQARAPEPPPAPRALLFDRPDLHPRWLAL